MESDKLLIVDDDEGIRSQLALAFGDELTCLQAGDAETATAIFRKERPNVVALDITLSPYEGSPDGLSLLTDILEFEPTTKVIMVTGDTDTKTALEAVSRGAFDYYQKPIQFDELHVVVKRALYLQRLEKENRRLADQLTQTTPSSDLWGESPPMQEVFRLIRTVAPSDYAVLITGESGTGKELAARAIHHQSRRAGGPFIPINCGAIPEKLLESELFGHERGAFTDAVTQKRGKFEIAHGGTLFLDEVGELPTPLQVKLLRFLQDQKVERLGGTKMIPVDVRIICATNLSLEAEVKAGRFREDLYYRISVINVNMPPLRDRGDDILLLARSFLRIAAREQQRDAMTISAGGEAALKRYAWPGNVRELENKIRRAVLLSPGTTISGADLGLEQAPTMVQDLATVRDAAERQAITQAITRHTGNVTRAAKELGVSRTTLYDLMRKHDIKQTR